MTIHLIAIGYTLLLATLKTLPSAGTANETQTNTNLENEMNTYNMQDAHKASDAYILSLIENLQAIQKTHRYTAPAWRQASEMLEPLFKEMAKRTK